MAEAWQSPKGRSRGVEGNQILLPDGLEPGERKVLFQLPPSGTLKMSSETKSIVMGVALWELWHVIAGEQAAAAEEARESDEAINRAAAALANPNADAETLPGQAEADRQASEMKLSMVAVTAAAMAIDGLYGSIKDIIQPPRSDAARPRQILEALKLGFKIGRKSEDWRVSLDWLFETRDYAVHHAFRLEQPYALRDTGQALLVGAQEAYYLDSRAARRAADFVDEVVDTCLDNPKLVMLRWVEETRDLSDGAPTAEVS
jgi:hypothetical protein